VFGSKSVGLISDVSSGMDSGCLVWVSGLGSRVYLARSSYNGLLTFEVLEKGIILQSVNYNLKYNV